MNEKAVNLRVNQLLLDRIQEAENSFNLTKSEIIRTDLEQWLDQNHILSK
ncbi:hypothetical protein F7734_11470 [Scytonema sp. UIC 10036]|nr:hypothetical protein [Scytonema sp. UIC 10036]